MPQYKRNEIRAGLLILIAFILMCVGIVVIADFQSYLKPMKTYHFAFDEVSGLKINDMVRYAGIKSGFVKNIEKQTLADDGTVGARAGG